MTSFESPYLDSLAPPLPRIGHAVEVTQSEAALLKAGFILEEISKCGDVPALNVSLTSQIRAGVEPVVIPTELADGAHKLAELLLKAENRYTDGLMSGGRMQEASRRMNSKWGLVAKMGLLSKFFEVQA